MSSEKIRSPRTEVHPFFQKALLDSMHPKPMHGGEVTDAHGVHRVISAHSSAFLVSTNESRDEFLLVDTGMDKKARNIHDTLRSINPDLGLAAVKAVFVTHGHIDHARGLGAFPHADIYASEYDIPYLLGKKRSEGAMKLRLAESARPDASQVTPIGLGDAITVGDRTMRVYDAPGHTSGSLAFAMDDVLFAGDAVYFREDDTAALPPEALASDVEQAGRSIGELVWQLDQDGVEIRTVLPSHSGAGGMNALRNFKS